jgi:hypothetical protein
MLSLYRYAGYGKMIVVCNGGVAISRLIPKNVISQISKEIYEKEFDYEFIRSNTLIIPQWAPYALANNSHVLSI